MALNVFSSETQVSLPNINVALRVLAVDSKKHIRTWMGGEFFASIGVCLDLQKPEEFRTKCEAILQTTLKKYGYEVESRTLKSFQVATLFSERMFAFHNFLADFSNQVLSLEDIKTGIFYTTLNTKSLYANAHLNEATATPPGSDASEGAASSGNGDGLKNEGTDEKDSTYDAKTIKKYGKPGFSVVTTSPKEFLNALDNYYGVVCAWKYAEMTQTKNQQVLLDGFEGAEVTDAWTDLVNNNVVHVAFRGDMCNAYLSAADLVTRFLDFTLKAWKMPLLSETMDRVIDSVCTKETRQRILVKRISNADLRYIVPSERRKIDLSAYLLHPVVFLSKEEDTMEERILFEKSPKMARLLDRAYALNGSVVFYEPTKHSAYIKAGDFFAYYGDKGKDRIARLNRMGYNVLPLDLTS